MCDLDVLIVVRDRLLDKVTQYTSESSYLGDGASGAASTLSYVCSDDPCSLRFTIEKAYERMMKDIRKEKNIKTFTDADYESLKIQSALDLNPENMVPKAPKRDLVSHFKPIWIEKTEENEQTTSTRLFADFGQNLN